MASEISRLLIIGINIIKEKAKAYETGFVHKIKKICENIKKAIISRGGNRNEKEERKKEERTKEKRKDEQKKKGRKKKEGRTKEISENEKKKERKKWKKAKGSWK